MTCDLIIAGVGGQGILAIAAIIARAALDRGLHFKQSEVHGMSQRGGAVQSHVRLSDQPIHAAVIPLGRADLILAVEPLEGLRYLPWLAPAGWLISNDQPLPNLANFPPLAEVHAAVRQVPHHLLHDFSSVAKAHGLQRALNLALLGAATPLLPLSAEDCAAAIAAHFASKGADVVARNLAVFRAGCALAAAG